MKKTVSCRFCNKYFSSKKALIDHRKDKHVGLNNKDYSFNQELQLYTCNKCQITKFNSKNKINLHLKKYHQIGQSENEIQSELEGEDNEILIRKKCPYCVKLFNQRGIKNHIKSAHFSFSKKLNIKIKPKKQVKKLKSYVSDSQKNFPSPYNKKYYRTFDKK